MITIIFGLPRAGKTALMTSFAINRMNGNLAFEDIQNCKRKLVKLNSGGFSLTIPKKHLVFADYFIVSRGLGYPMRSSYYVNGYRLGLPNRQHETLFLPPYSQIYLDEAQKYFNSRESKNLADFVSRFYEMHGHNFYNITMCCQRATLIDLNIRQIGGRFIEIVDLKHHYDSMGNIKKSVWTCNEFIDGFAVDNYLGSNKQKNNGKKTKYTFEGDIFKCYDSFGFGSLFYKDNYDKDFDIYYSVPSGWDLNSIKRFNTVYDYEIPQTYYKQKKREVKSE